MIKVRFSPGGESPEVFSLLSKPNAEKTVSREYTAYNDDNSAMRVTFSGIPSGMSVTPSQFFVPIGGSTTFRVTVEDSYFRQLSAGQDITNISIQIESV